MSHCRSVVRINNGIREEADDSEPQQTQGENRKGRACPMPPHSVADHHNSNQEASTLDGRQNLEAVARTPGERTEAEVDSP